MIGVWGITKQYLDKKFKKKPHSNQINSVIELVERLEKFIEKYPDTAICGVKVVSFDEFNNVCDVRRSIQKYLRATNNTQLKCTMKNGEVYILWTQKQ